MKRREFITKGAGMAGILVKGNGIDKLLPAGEWTIEGTSLYSAFRHPPQSAQVGGFWWWFNGLVSKEGITRDLEAFHDKGIGEVLLINTASGLGGAKMPQGVKFLSEEWSVLYRHALQEAARLGITVGVNFTSGWCMGGPWIDPQHAGRWFLQSRLAVTGPQQFSGALPLPGHRDGYDKMVNAPGYKDYIDLPLEKLDYRDTAVVAFPVQDEAKVRLHDQPAELFSAKTNRKDASNFIKAKDLTAPLLQPFEVHASDEAVPVDRVIDLSGFMDKDGRLQWAVPEGKWIILRTGHRMTGSKLTIAQPEADGLSVDWLSGAPVDIQFEHLGKRIIADAGDLKGKTLKFLHDDSFEDGFPNWTADILEKFQHYRGYDPRPYLPVLNGFIIGSVEVASRFLHDYRKTVADCMADGHYGQFARRCHENGLLMHNEAAGPNRSGTMCMDGLKNLGRSDYPAGEFWLGLKHDEEGGLDEHQSYGVTRLEGGQNKVTKMTASAAHIYGKTLVSAESFTSFRHWLDYPGNMKQAADRAFCEGVNRMLIHAITCTRPEDGKPGYEYGAGTHFNPNVTWWPQAGPFLQYLARCQYLLRQGQFVADVLYYNGDWAPNIVEPKHTDPSLGKGYDYDVCNEEVLLTRLSVKDGLIVLPDGMHYRMLVLPEERRMPVAVARKLRTLVKAGATVVGARPLSDPGLKDYPMCDREVTAIGEEVWGACDGVNVLQRVYGKGRVFWNMPLRDILAGDAIAPDFEFSAASGAFIDFIHRRTADEEIYFIVNRNDQPGTVHAWFRVKDRQPVRWDPVTGEAFDLPDFRVTGDRTGGEIAFLPFESMFIVFPRARVKGLPGMVRAGKEIQSLPGPWTVQFDEQWGGPASIVFDELTDWTLRPEEGIKYYSGTAVYRKRFDLPSGVKKSAGRLFLNLGVVKNIASVRLNGKDLGVVWTHPWTVEITAAVKEKDNLLEVNVINLWPNRLIGDATLPPEQRRTHTNIAFYDKSKPLLSSGLLGPVTIQNTMNL